MDIPIPDRRRSIEGRTIEGRPVRLQNSFAPRPYTCPGCRREVAIGAEHVLVRYFDNATHQHWHRDCVEEILVPILRETRVVEEEKPGGRGRRRAEADRRRRRRG